MGTRIDYLAVLKPIETILKIEGLSEQEKIKTALEVITAILENAEK